MNSQLSKLVPMEPTTKMIDAAILCSNEWPRGSTDFGGLYRAMLAATGEPAKLWLWKNFVDGRPEYWAFDNPYPTRMDCGDPQTFGEPCGYAIFKPSRQGRTDVGEESVIAAIKRASSKATLRNLSRMDGWSDARYITELEGVIQRLLWARDALLDVRAIVEATGA